MANFDSGVYDYIHASATVHVNFPVDKRGNAEIACKHCQFYSRYGKTCKLNDRPIAYPEQFVGQDCPLEEDKE